jgi:CheY-like chemotaxis protein
MSDDAPHVLIVDDEARFRQYLRARLQRAFPSASILLTGDPEEALRVLRTQPIDLILSDHHLPRFDGVTMLEHARDARPAAIRILLTGGVDPSKIDAALAKGTIHAALQKPIEGDVLIQHVERLMSTRRLHAPAGSGAFAAAESMDSPRGPRRALVVDDILAVAKVWATLANRLDPTGIDVVIETDARKAVERLRGERFDLIITYYRMPELSGIDILIHAKEQQPDARRVLVTGYNEVPESASRLHAADVDAYVHKPMPAQDAVLLLRDALSGDPRAMDTHREQARILEGQAERDKAPLDLDDA